MRRIGRKTLLSTVAGNVVEDPRNRRWRIDERATGQSKITTPNPLRAHNR